MNFSFNFMIKVFFYSYLAYELHGTFNIIWSGKCMVYSPLNMIAAVRRLLPTFEPCAMEDAQEFLE